VVAAGATPQPVIPTFAVEDIQTHVAVDAVASFTAVKGVVSGSPDDRVIACITRVEVMTV
jgi:hypothetical protein